MEGEAAGGIGDGLEAEVREFMKREWAGLQGDPLVGIAQTRKHAADRHRCSDDGWCGWLEEFELEFGGLFSVSPVAPALRAHRVGRNEAIVIAREERRGELSDLDGRGAAARFRAGGTRAVRDGGTVLEVESGFMALRVDSSRQQCRVGACMRHGSRPHAWKAARVARGRKRRSIAARPRRDSKKRAQQPQPARGSSSRVYGSPHLPMMACWTQFVTLLARVVTAARPSHGAVGSLKHSERANDALRLENVLDMKAFSS